MNCLHVLAANSKENAQLIFNGLLETHPTFPLDIQDGQGNTGKSLTDFFFEAYSRLCQALLLAYKNGHGQLCRALVTAGANLSICNNDALSIFTIPAASRALLVNILGKSLLKRETGQGMTISSIDIITREPPWGESETCLACGTKFTITNRRHHWFVSAATHGDRNLSRSNANQWSLYLFLSFSRHCGRVLCKRCSVNELPIMKFNLQKPVRVCQLCNDVLTLGVMAARWFDKLPFTWVQLYAFRYIDVR